MKHTVGIDLGDKYSSFCVLNEKGKAADKGRISMRQSAVRKVAGALV